MRRNSKKKFVKNEFAIKSKTRYSGEKTLNEMLDEFKSKEELKWLQLHVLYVPAKNVRNLSTGIKRRNVGINL